MSGPIDAQITFLPSSDLAASRAFYGGVLGLDLVVDQGVCLIFRVTDDAFIGTCEHLEPVDQRSVIVTLVTEDVDGWCDRIRMRGGQFRSGPEHSERFGIYHAFIDDPDGNHLEIQRFDDPNWSEPGTG